MDQGKVALDGTPQEIFARQDEIRSMNLDVPLSVELCHRLRKRGIEIPSDIINMEEMVGFLCQYK